jgi:ABC-2 type transport system permease protein
MNTLHLLKPSVKKIGRIFATRNKLFLVTIFVCAALLYAGIYFGMARFLSYVSKAPIIGDAFGAIIGGLIISKLLEMLFMTLFFMLLFSGVISALSILFLDTELQPLMVSPQPVSRIFMSRLLMLTFDSSWMAVIFFFPVFLAFAKTLNAFSFAYICFPIALLCFVLIPNIIGAGSSLLIAAFFPIRQMKKIFQFLAIIMLTGLIFFIRSLEAEKLLNPSHFKSVSGYLISLDLPLVRYSPATWMHQTTLNLFYGRFNEALSNFWPILITVVIGLVILWVLAKYFYHYSWQRSCEAMDNQIIGLEWLRKIIIKPFKFFAPDVNVIASKEITIFLRDPAVFSQIFMMMAIIVIYAYNLAILPIKDVPTMFTQGLNNALIYLNGPFIGFIVASIGMRFVYPSVSMEGRAFWAVKSSPVSPKRVLLIKVLFYLVPMIILGLILCTVTNAIFTVSTPVLRWLSYFNVLLITIVITSLAIGVGSVNADFNADSPLKIAGSYGGFIYMILSGLYIANLVFLEAYPIYCFNYSNQYYVRGFGANILFFLSIIVILLASAAWIYLPIRKGLDAIEEYEPE